jgi:hypothetical protein
VIGYDVTYEYQGKRYNSRLAQDPGAQVALNVSVTPAGQAVTSMNSMPVAPMVVYAPTPVYGYDVSPSPAIVQATQIP